MRGYTLIELLLTLVLLGILSVAAMGLFANKNSFSVTVVADQVMSQLNLTQQVALGRHSFNAAGVPVDTRFNISSSGGELDLSVTQGNYQSASRVNADSVTVSWKTSATTHCGSATAVTSSDLTVNFNHAGETNNNVLICLAGQRQIPICITRLGLVYEGFCES